MPKVCAACLVLILSLAAGTSEASSIVINPGTGLTANADALAAFQRAADTLGAQFSDPVTISIAADLEVFGPGIIGTASSTLLSGGYTLVRDAMVTDAADEPDDAIVASLPTLAEFSTFVPAGFSLNGQIVLTQANAKALGLVFGGNDATLVFNSAFGFDYDNSDGVGAGLIDFETVVLHELVGVLGFFSNVDLVDFLLDQNSPEAVRLAPLDLFRFVCASAPDTSAEFTSTTRTLVPGAPACTSDTVNTWAMSTGSVFGDGRQASNWKDDSLSGVHLGIMDPTLATGVSFGLSAADIRALSLIGWDPVADDAAPVPEPATLGLLASGLGILAAARRRRRARGRRIDV